MSSTTGHTVLLPAPLTSFIGREREVGEIADLLRGPARLLTLVGPGGVGKTRLAIQAATRIADHFSDGVWFVDLSPLTDSALVLPAIAHTIGLQESGAEPIEPRLITRLAERRALLVIDNVEQVVSCAPDLAHLVAQCSGLVILATSREPLSVGGEQEYPVPPLAIEIDSEAVRLFVDRAHAILPSFVLTDEVAPIVIEICRRLDGLPLAIELAAARIKTLPPAELLNRLDHRLPLLTGTRRDAPQRHHTMRDAIAWSYDLLSPTEQTLFRRLAIFVGGFTLEAAEAIAGDLNLDILVGVASLVDKSLIRQVASETGAARHTMLETVREYGLERLEEHAELEQCRAQHTAWVADFADSIGEAQGLISIEELADLAAEHDNARAALRGAIDASEGETALRIATRFYQVWLIQGYLSEGRRWLAEAITLDTAVPVELQAAALSQAGWLALQQGDLSEAEASFERVMSIPQNARAERFRFPALIGLGNCAAHRGDLDTAESRYREVLVIAPSHGAQISVAHALGNLGILAAMRGDLEAAAGYYEEGLPLLRSAGAEFRLSEHLANMGSVARDQGDYRRSAAAFRESLSVSLRLAYRWHLGDCCAQAAEVAFRRGQHERAARLAGVAERVRADLGRLRDPDRAQEIDALEAALCARLGEEAYLREWSAGYALPLEAAVIEADAVFAEEEAAPVPALSPLDPAAAHGLTPRETEVLRLLAKDWSNQQIADHLFLSRRTVHKHVENILGKLEVDSRAGAAVWAVRHGLD